MGKMGLKFWGFWKLEFRLESKRNFSFSGHNVVMTQDSGLQFLPEVGPLKTACLNRFFIPCFGLIIFQATNLFYFILVMPSSTSLGFNQ